jgi:hypothetical protein
MPSGGCHSGGGASKGKTFCQILNQQRKKLSKILLCLTYRDSPDLKLSNQQIFSQYVCVLNYLAVKYRY